jgi:hypothetical protein
MHKKLYGIKDMKIICNLAKKNIETTMSDCIRNMVHTLECEHSECPEEKMQNFVNKI